MVGLLVVLVIAVAGPGDPDARWQRIDRAAERVLDTRYQKELPRYRDLGDRPREAAGDRRWHPRLDRDGRSRRRGDSGGSIEPRGTSREPHRPADSPSRVLASWMLWGGLAVVIILGVVWLLRELSRYHGDAELDPTAPAQRAIDTGVIDRPLDDADQLAQQGRFAEAIHTLLLRTLQELARVSSTRIVPSLTSREILARISLVADARAALGGLITAVELTYFGDDVPGAADWERCRDQFHVFAAAYRRGGAPASAEVAA